MSGVGLVMPRRGRIPRRESVEGGDLHPERSDLVGLAREVARLLTAPATRRIITAIVAALPDRPATAEAARTFFADRLQREQAIFDRARARGEFSSDRGPDPTMVVDLIAGNLWFRSLVRVDPVDEPYLTELVDTVLAGVAPQASG